MNAKLLIVSYRSTNWLEKAERGSCFFVNGSLQLAVHEKVLNWAPCHLGVLGEWRYSSTHSMTSALDGEECSASRPGRFTQRERAPGTHWVGGWVGPRTVLDAVVKGKIPSPHRESNPRTPIVQPVVQRYTDWAITALLTIGLCVLYSIKRQIILNRYMEVKFYSKNYPNWRRQWCQYLYAIQ
jgi:hypothetical protein